MPNKPVHLAVAIPVGTFAAAHKASNINGLEYFWEVLGGGVGALAGGLGPDIMDPPTHPNHRGLGHSLVANITVGKVMWDHLDTWQDQLRREADRMQQLQLAALDPVLKLAYGTWEIVLRLLAGALVGFAVGWGTHVALDFGTARSLPLLC
jgi:hypothetical protein